MIFWKPKAGPNICFYQCLESITIAHSNYSGCLNLAFKTMTCVMTLMVSVISRLSPDVIENTIPYGLPMGPEWE